MLFFIDFRHKTTMFDFFPIILGGALGFIVAKPIIHAVLDILGQIGLRGPMVWTIVRIHISAVFVRGRLVGIADIIGHIHAARRMNILGSRGIRANAIAPGFILTDMTKALSEETLKQFVSLIPMRRGGDPEEVAKVALFLASDLSSYVSGQVIQVNGAMA